MYLPALHNVQAQLPVPAATIAAPVAFPLPIIKFKKKCCKDFKTGKRCKRCPGRMKEYMRQRAAAVS